MGSITLNVAVHLTRGYMVIQKVTFIKMIWVLLFQMPQATWSLLPRVLQ